MFLPFRIVAIVLLLLPWGNSSCTRLNNLFDGKKLICGADFQSDEPYYQVLSPARGEALAVNDFQVLELKPREATYELVPLSSRGCFHMQKDSDYVVRSLVDDASLVISSKQSLGLLDQRQLTLQMHEPDPMNISCPQKPISAAESWLSELIVPGVQDAGPYHIHASINPLASEQPSESIKGLWYSRDLSAQRFAAQLSNGLYKMDLKVRDLRRGTVRQLECAFEIDNDFPLVTLDRSGIESRSVLGQETWLIERQEKLRFTASGESAAHAPVTVEYCFEPLSELELSKLAPFSSEAKACPSALSKSATLTEGIWPEQNYGFWRLSFRARDEAGNVSPWASTRPLLFFDKQVLEQFRLESRSDIMTAELGQPLGIMSLLKRTFTVLEKWDQLKTKAEQELSRDEILSMLYASYLGLNGSTQVVNLPAISNRAILSADGSIAVAGLGNGDVEVFDAQRWVPLRMLHGHRDNVSSLALSADGKRLVTASFDRTLRTWDLSSGQELGVMACCKGDFSRVAISPDGQKVVSTSWDSGIQVWSLEGLLLKTIDATTEPTHYHKDIITDVAMSPTDRQFVTVSWDKSVKLWNLDTGEFVRDMASIHTDGLNAVVYSRDGNSVFSAGKDGILAQFATQDGHLIRTFAQLSTAMWSLTTTQNEIIAGGLDNFVRRWSIDSGQLTADPMKFDHLLIGSLSATPDGKIFLAATNKPFLQVWGESKNSSIMRSLRGHEMGSSVRALLIDAEGERLFTAGSDKKIIAWDLNTEEPLWKSQDQLDTIYDLKLNLKGDRLYAASRDGRLRVYDSKTFEAFGPIYEHLQEWMFSIDFGRDPYYPYVGTWNGKIIAPSGETSGLIEEGSTEGWSKVAYDRKRNKLLTLNRNKTLWIHDPLSLKRERLLSQAEEAFISGDFGAHDDVYIAGLWSGKVLVSDLETFTQKQIFDTKGGIVWSLLYDRDSQLILTGTQDGSLRIFDPNNGTMMGVPLLLGNKALRSLSYDSRQGRVYLGDDGGNVFRWTLPLTRDVSRLRDLVCKQAKDILQTSWFRERYNFSQEKPCEKTVIP